MSLATKPMQVVQISDPLLDLTDVSTFPVYTGAQKTNYQQITTTSISSSNLSFSYNPPTSTFVDRRVMLSCPFRLIITGRVTTTNAGLVTPSTLLNAQKCALRDMPIHTMINSGTVQLNSDNYTYNSPDSFAALRRYNMSAELGDRDLSGTASYLDQCANYADLPAGTARNPLGNFANSGAHIQRGGFSGWKVVQNPVVVPAVAPGTAAVAIIDAVCHEDLMFSPFHFGKIASDKQAFWGLNNINVSLNFFTNTFGGKLLSYSEEAIVISGADRIFGSIDSIQLQFNNFTGPAFSFPQAVPYLQFKCLTPNLLASPAPSLLGSYNYSYYDTNQQVTSIPAIPYSATGSVQRAMNSITLSQIPRKVCICVRPSTQTMQTRPDLTDSFLSIEAINIQFNNQSGILNGATQKQLYDISVKNGYSLSWDHFSCQPIQNGALLGTAGAGTYCGNGTVLMLNFGEDIYLDVNEAAGLANGNYQFSATLTIGNRNNSGRWDALPLEITVCFITDGVMTYSAGNISHQVAVISSQDVLNSREQPGLTMMNFRSDPAIMSGGGWWDDISGFASKVNDFLKQSKIISTVGKAVSPIIPYGIGNVATGIAENLGYGYNVGGKMMQKRSLMYR